MSVSRVYGEQESVVHTKFGDRPIVQLPAFALGSGKNVNSNFADVPPGMLGPREFSYNVGRNVNRDNANVGYIGQYFNQPTQHSYQNQSSNFIQESNIIPYPSFNTVTTQHPSIIPQGQVLSQGQAFPQDQVVPPPNNGVQQEIHHYYGPNGERLPGPPNNFMRNMQSNVERKQYPMNFKVDATLEYGKMVSLKIREGNVSFRDIPDFVLNDCKKTYRIIPKVDVTIVADDGEYNVFSALDPQDPLNQNIGYMYDQSRRDEYERKVVVYPRSYSPARRRPEYTIVRYADDYYRDDHMPRGQSAPDHYTKPPVKPERHWYSSDRVVHLDTQSDRGHHKRHPVRQDRHWYSRDNIVHIGTNRKPLPMRPRHSRN